jgi:hypothetical protein
MLSLIGIAQVSAQSGFNVTLVDLDAKTLASAQQRINDSIGRVAKKKFADNKVRRLSMRLPMFVVVGDGCCVFSEHSPKIICRRFVFFIIVIIVAQDEASKWQSSVTGRITTSDSVATGVKNADFGTFLLFLFRCRTQNVCRSRSLTHTRTHCSSDRGYC